MKIASSDSITRRSFIKQSAVAGVAASSLMIFSGLVNAQGAAGTGSDPECSINKVEETLEFPGSNIKIPIYTCTGGDPICDDKVPCGRMFLFDAQTGLPILDENNQIQWFNVKVDCKNDRGDNGGVFCHRPPPVLI